MVRKNEELKREKEILENFLGRSQEKIIGRDSGLKEVFKMIGQVANLECPVLILGETGTGKELAANEIHRLSWRSDRKMVRINCGAIPETLIDSELFGHEKGAFTGALNRKMGVFEQADKSTVFLDEIGELSFAAQAKLLRVLQTMEFRRVGGHIPVSVNVRIIAATNRDLFKMVQERKFREDLWFRLNVFPILIPPLRKRKEDIKGLAVYFTEKKSREMNLERIPEISEKEFKKKKKYPWPGNIREMENIIERSIILHKEGIFEFDGLLNTGSPEDKKGDNFFSQELLPLEDVIKNHIKKALQVSGCRIEGKSGAAEILKINPSTLRSKMKKLEIKLNRTTE